MKRLYSISYIRLFAASMVLLSHIAHKAEQYGYVALEWYNFRGFGVDLFFVLSGFIACYTTFNKEIVPTDFIKKRIKRLIPLYWFFTTIALFIYLYNPNLVNSSGGNTSILSSYFLIPNGDKYLINNGWTLFYDFCFYLIFFFMLFFNIKSVNRLLYIITVLVVIALIGIIFGNFDYFNSVIMLEFALGMIIFFIFKNELINLKSGIFFILLGFILLLAQNICGEFKSVFGRSLNKGVPVSFIFLGFLGIDAFLNPLKNSVLTILSKIGESSYSLFLSHPFVLVVISKIYRKYEIIQIVPFSLFLYVSAVFVGYYIFVFIEKPMNKFFKS